MEPTYKLSLDGLNSGVVFLSSGLNHIAEHNCIVIRCFNDVYATHFFHIH